ncbi:MAG: type II toxin-antitoxin system death-on-curing family toxin [Bacteroidota bacterium]
MTQEPRWVGRALVEALHHDQLKTYGGRYGVRDANLLESALARPQQKWAYEEGTDVFDLAAAYAYGIAKNHPFVDGNKRTAFAVMTLFLVLNGHPLQATEPDAIIVMLGVASGDLGEAELATWCRRHGNTTSE